MKTVSAPAAPVWWPSCRSSDPAMDNGVKAILIVLAVVLALGTVCLLSTTQIVVLPM